MIEKIIRVNEKRIEEDIKNIEGIKSIDFIDIFPISEEHKTMLDNEAKNIAKIVDRTEKGTFYLLNKPIETKWGPLKFFKIRFFDETRLNWEASSDFAVENWNKLMNKVGKEDNYGFYCRKEWKALEYKTNDSLIYFLNPLITTIYNIK